MKLKLPGAWRRYPYSFKAVQYRYTRGKGARTDTTHVRVKQYTNGWGCRPVRRRQRAAPKPTRPHAATRRSSDHDMQHDDP
eukprot:5916377-Prymnesium_polylepis.1